MAQLLELLTTASLQLKSGNNNPIPLKSFSNPTNIIDNIIYGNIPMDEYLGIANDVKSYMDSTGKTPDYDYQTSLGTYLGYQNLVYMYSKILNYHKVNSKLPDSVSMNSWKFVSSPTIATFTMDQIKDAASRVKNFVETNETLPNYVTIGSIQVSMPQFLELLSSATLQLTIGNTDSIILKNYSSPTNPKDTIKSGNIPKTEYLTIANDVKSYMDSTGKTPDYDYQTSLGTYLGYQNLVYMYSKIIDYYTNNGKMPDSVSMKSWSVVTGQTTEIPDDLTQYLQSTTNCQVGDTSINALAWSLAQGGNGLAESTKIFNWVRDKIGYTFYYNTKYGAVSTLKNGSGNCVDTSHLLIALLRAAGIPSRYVHGECTFSSGRYGHVWAQVYVNGQWYDADATSSRNTFGVINNWNTETYTFKGIYSSLPF